MSTTSDFRSTITSLWFRLITLGIVGLVFALVWLAQGKALGWASYLSKPVVLFEVLVRDICAALAGIALGSILTAAIAPFLWYFKSWRERIADWATKVAVVLVVFLDSKRALDALIWWSYQWIIRWFGRHPFFMFCWIRCCSSAKVTSGCWRTADRNCCCTCGVTRPTGPCRFCDGRSLCLVCNCCARTFLLYPQLTRNCLANSRSEPWPAP